MPGGCRRPPRTSFDVVREGARRAAAPGGRLGSAVDVRADGVEPGAPRAAGRGGSWSGWPRAEVSRGAGVRPRDGTSVARGRGGQHRHPRRARAQPQERRRRHPARAARRHHRALGLGQVDPRLRHALRRGAAALRRVALRLRPAVPRSRWRSPTTTPSTASRPPSRSSRRAASATRAPPSARSPRSPTTCACSSRASGMPHCFQCGREIARADRAAGRRPPGRAAGGDAAFLVCAGRARPEGRAQQELRRALRRGGFVRVRVDGTCVELADDSSLAKTEGAHASRSWSTASSCRPGIERRLADSLETALRYGDGIVLVERDGPGGRAAVAALSERHACPTCGVSFPELAPRFFSFNSPQGACPTCAGLGMRRRARPGAAGPRPRRSRCAAALARGRRAGAARLRREPDGARGARPRSDATRRGRAARGARTALLYGTGERGDRVKSARGAARRPSVRRHRRRCSRCASARRARLAARRDRGPRHRSALSRLRRARACGARRASCWSGGRSIVDVSALPIGDAARLLRRRSSSARSETRDRAADPEGDPRRGWASCVDVGLGYLTLDRPAPHALGRRGPAHPPGEPDRSRLTGVIYVLDEPSIGLHQRDTARLLATLHRTCATSATRSSWSSTTARPSAPPTT